MAFRVACEGQGIRLQGDLTVEEAPQALGRLREALTGPEPLFVDLSGLGRLDEAGLQVLLWLRRTVPGAAFCDVGPEVRALVAQRRLADLLGIAPPQA